MFSSVFCFTRAHPCICAAAPFCSANGSPGGLRGCELPIDRSDQRPTYRRIMARAGWKPFALVAHNLVVASVAAVNPGAVVKVSASLHDFPFLAQRLCSILACPTRVWSWLDGVEEGFEEEFLLEFFADAVAMFGDEEFGFDCFSRDDAEFRLRCVHDVDHIEKVGDEVPFRRLLLTLEGQGYSRDGCWLLRRC